MRTDALVNGRNRFCFRCFFILKRRVAGRIKACENTVKRVINPLKITEF